MARGDPFLFLDGRKVSVGSEPFLGAALLRAFDADVTFPSPDEAPYLFCGNGACRDCNLTVEGFPDLPSCRLPLVSGMSLRSGEGAGEENALSRNVPRSHPGETWTFDLVVVGGGPAGRAAAEEARRLGVEAVLFEARDGESGDEVRFRRTVGVERRRLFVLDEGGRHPIDARAIVLANGARDEPPSCPGASLAGVLPVDLLVRYLALGEVPGRSLLLVGEVDEDLARSLPGKRVTRATEVEAFAGGIRVERARLPGGIEVAGLDLVFVRSRRVPVLVLAKALGCETLYDRALSCERLVLGDKGDTSLPGVFAAGDVASPVGFSLEAARRTGRAAAIFLDRA